MKWDLKKVDSKDGSSSERVWNFKAEKKCKNPFRLFFCFKIPYSFLDLILWVLKITLRIFSIIMQIFQVIFNTCKNNEKIIPSAMMQKRRQVCGFLFAY
jgi:hypothetical protein